MACDSGGKGAGFVIALFGYAIFGYVTASLTSFFIGRDAEDKKAPLAAADDMNEIKKMIAGLSEKLNKMA